ncbi:MAG: type I-MYXAN CRISPR-associated Cas8a1/Cmx1 [Candidatus Goldbacteria bacterium]|nr:type I-MYXAN CRISPR-associated Cas8a1/Cmx1 [Candidatus Goldiibacteriota bacterium]
MGKRINQQNTKQELRISLFGPGMTALHKVGLAGLYMTLKALEKEKGIPALKHGSWKVSDTDVVLRWGKNPDAFFKELFKESFKIDKEGFFWFPALGKPENNRKSAALLQESILGTFLQHGRTRKFFKGKNAEGSINISDDKKLPVFIRYRKIKSYPPYQTGEFNYNGFNKILGVYFPGGAERHQGLKGFTEIEEPPERALCLRYSIIGAIYYEIKSRKEGIKAQYAVVIPNITNLKEYSNIRKHVLKYGVKNYYVSGAKEAGIKMITEMESIGMLKDIRSTFCRVISYGTVPWSSKQKTRVGAVTIKLNTKRDYKVFKYALSCFEPYIIKRDKDQSFYSVPQMSGFIADNLSLGYPWWRGFSDYIATRNTAKIIFFYEKGGLQKMVENKEVLPDGVERIFVEVCHEAWRRHMGWIGEKVEREHGSFDAQVSREFEKTRIAFSRCKNPETLRNSVIDFWSRAGRIDILSENWQNVIRLFDADNWKKAKDLALLALASYPLKSKEKKEKK